MNFVVFFVSLCNRPIAKRYNFQHLHPDFLALLLVFLACVLNHTRLLSKVILSESSWFIYAVLLLVEECIVLD